MTADGHPQQEPIATQTDGESEGRSTRSKSKRKITPSRSNVTVIEERTDVTEEDGTAREATVIDVEAEGATKKAKNVTPTSSRPKRKVPPQQYDETQRRGKRRRQHSHAYMESGKKRTHCNLKNAMVIGARTVERIVNGEYEWRDGGYKKNRRTGALFHEGWGEATRPIHDPG